MKISKILSYVILVVGALGIILWFVMNSAFSTIEAQELDIFSDEGFAAVSPLYTLTLIILVVLAIATVASIFTSLAKNPAGLKKALIGIGAFLVVTVICYILGNGTEVALKDGGVVTAGESKWIGAGLYGFYLLAAIAVGLMVLSGVKKLIGK